MAKATVIQAQILLSHIGFILRIFTESILGIKGEIDNVHAWDRGAGLPPSLPRICLLGIQNGGLLVHILTLWPFMLKNQNWIKTKPKNNQKKKNLKYCPQICNTLSHFMTLGWTVLIALLGSMWPTGHGLELSCGRWVRLLPVLRLALTVTGLYLDWCRLEEMAQSGSFQGQLFCGEIQGCWTYDQAQGCKIQHLNHTVLWPSYRKI